MRGVNRQPRKVIRVSQIDLIESDSDDEDVSFFHFLTLIRKTTPRFQIITGDRQRITLESFSVILTDVQQRAKSLICQN